MLAQLFILKNVGGCVYCLRFVYSNGDKTEAISQRRFFAYKRVPYRATERYGPNRRRANASALWRGVTEAKRGCRGAPVLERNSELAQLCEDSKVVIFGETRLGEE